MTHDPAVGFDPDKASIEVGLERVGAQWMGVVQTCYGEERGPRYVSPLYDAEPTARKEATRIAGVVQAILRNKFKTVTIPVKWVGEMPS